LFLEEVGLAKRQHSRYFQLTFRVERLCLGNVCLRRLFCLFVLPFASTLTLAGEDTAPPIKSARFSPDAKVIFAAASESSPVDGTDIAVLDQEESYVYASNGRSVYTEYLVYKVLTQKGAEGWDSISVDWEP
jgi:hypothetical protein